MLISLFVLVTIGWFINHSFDFLIKDFWFTSGLLLLILLSLIDQPHFSKDSNVFVNAITAALSLLLVQNKDCIFWAFLCFIGYLIFSSYFLMWYRNNELRNENRFIQLLSRINRELGKPDVIFSAFFLWGGIQQYTINSSEFNALLWFWIIFMLLNVPSLANAISSLFEKNNHVDNVNAVGKIFGVQSKNIFLVKLFEDRKVSLNVFDFVRLRYSIDNKVKSGMVLDVYWLEQEQWVKVLISPDIKLADPDIDLVSDIAYKIDLQNQETGFENLIGVVSENSVIEKIRFIYNSKNEIADGQLVELTINSHKVLYQIVQGTTKVEQLEKKNESSFVMGEAIQLGQWNSEKQRFDKYGWVPNVNTPIFMVSDITDDSKGIDDNEFEIGKIPNTNYPIIINKELAVTHHTAILGVTGSGKSVFARNLIKQIASDDTKVIIVDLTGEYKSKMADISSIINNEDSTTAFNAIEIIAKEKAKFANQQDKKTIETSY